MASVGASPLRLPCRGCGHDALARGLGSGVARLGTRLAASSCLGPVCGAWKGPVRDESVNAHRRDNPPPPSVAARAHSSVPHHDGGPANVSGEDLDEEDHRSSQVALLALVPIGLLGLKWAVSTGPMALVVPLVLLAFPIAGSGLRQLLAEGVSMAVRCRSWMHNHQPQHSQARQPGGSSADHSHAAHHTPAYHAHHAQHTTLQHHSNGGASSGNSSRHSPGATSAAAPTLVWGAATPAVSASHGLHAPLHAAALHPMAGAQQAIAATTIAVLPSSPPSRQHMQQRQPTGAWADVTIALPAVKPSTPHAPSVWAWEQHQQQHPASHPPPTAPLAPTQAPQHLQQCQNSSTVGHSSPPGGAHSNKAPVLHGSSDPLHHAHAAAPPHAGVAPPTAAAAAAAPPAHPALPPPPPARPSTLLLPSPLQQLADVQQCEDIDWEVDVRRQQLHHHASGCATTSASSGSAVAAVGVAGSEGVAAPALMHPQHHYGLAPHHTARRLTPRGPAALPRGHPWP